MPNMVSNSRSPNVSWPFHDGEVQLQKRMGVHDDVMSYAPSFVRSFLPEQHIQFYSAQPFLVLAARDSSGSMWSTLLFADPTNTHQNGEASLARIPDPRTLNLHGRPFEGDALEQALLQSAGTDVGILGIEFATRRRNRVNGRMTSQGNRTALLELKVDQSFGNCPQYIKPRQWWWKTTSKENRVTTTSKPVRSQLLSTAQQAIITKAESIFVATGYRGEGDDPRWGNDASHRGGPSGFLRVLNPTTLLLPDFSGNNHFNTLGNLALDDRMGMTIPDFETGGMVQLTGRAVVDWDENRLALVMPGALRTIIFTVEQVNELSPGTMPIRWSTQAKEDNERKLQVSAKIQESSNIVSFHLSPRENDLQTLWDFNPGQHLPINIPVDVNGGEIQRTYSISAARHLGEYRISVKRQPFGKASTYLHDHIEVGDILTIQKPAGTFVLESLDDPDTDLIVLLSTGVGVTPVLSMLHEFVNTLDKHTKRALWVHGARDKDSHAFRGEVRDLANVAGPGRLKTHICYSQPGTTDTDYDSTGHVNTQLLQDLISIESLRHRTSFYMCGTASFTANMQKELESIGVDEGNIHFETF